VAGKGLVGIAATSAADLRRAMGAFGLESDSILGPGAGQRRAMVAARLPRDLASGYANVVVLSPFDGRNRTPPEPGAAPAGQFEGLRKFRAQTWQARSRPCASRAATSR
jgi:hypothetical protein